MKRPFLLLLALVVVGCDDDGGGPSDCPPGNLNCPCREDGTCGTLGGVPLACIDNVCVQSGPGDMGTEDVAADPDADPDVEMPDTAEPVDAPEEPAEVVEEPVVQPDVEEEPDARDAGVEVEPISCDGPEDCVTPEAQGLCCGNPTGAFDPVCEFVAFCSTGAEVCQMVEDCSPQSVSRCAPATVFCCPEPTHPAFSICVCGGCP